MTGAEVKDSGPVSSDSVDPGNDAAATLRASTLRVLRERGLLASFAGDEAAFAAAAAQTPLAVYCGFDPTAESLHLGNLVCIMALAWFQQTGHSVVALMGGATGRIGDPSGKSAERPMLDEAVVEANAASIAANVHGLLQRVPPCPVGEDATLKPAIMDNHDWWKDMSVLDFLRDVGRHARVGTMLAKDSVRARLDSESGLSFTEFSYQLMQGHDFVHLRRHHGVKVQVGGSDQWGNITAGTELVRKVLGTEAFGLTVPLLLKSDGTKFGKSESGAVWLSPDKLSPYGLYQALVDTADADVAAMLRTLTFLPLETVARLTAVDAPPGAAQRELAAQVTRFVHGEAALADALTITAALAPGSKAGTALNGAALAEAARAGAPVRALPRTQALGSTLVDVLVGAGAAESKSAARRLIQGGGLRLNNVIVADQNQRLGQDDLIDERMILLSLGKKRKLILELHDS